MSENFLESVTSFEDSLTFKIYSYQNWNNRGIALDNLGRYEEAIASYDKALAIKQDFHVAWNNRGYALFNLGRYEEAIASYDKALAIKQDVRLVWLNRGIALGKLGRNEEAIASNDKALEIKPDDHEAWNNRGLALEDLGRNEEAIASYDKALAIKPGDHVAWNNRGYALFNLGRYEEAIASYDKALAIKADLHGAWINRGIGAGNINPNRTQTPIFLSRLTLQNPKLNRRGYEGQLISYEEGLKFCQQDTHPEGWGLLHYAIGNAKYYRGRADRRRRRELWGEARESYNTALQTLTETVYPEEYLEVVKRLIPIQRWFGEAEAAKELSRHGSDLLRRLVRECKSPGKQKQLQLKFAGFNQLTVDLFVQEGNRVQAWEVAEAGKNACLTWLLNPKTEDILTPSYANIQQLLNPSTAAIYWHQSPAALHTFILTHNAAEPIVLPGKTEEAAFLKLLKFEDWVIEWNQQYQDYRQLKKEDDQAKKIDKKRHPWRTGMEERQNRLGEILNIAGILEELAGISQLILIPHRDLHPLPLESLFPNTFTLTRLPSAQFGINAMVPASRVPSIGTDRQDADLPEMLLSVETPDSQGFEKLPLSDVESAFITHRFPAIRIGGLQPTLAEVKAALKQPHRFFHFTGHGFANIDNPALSYLALAGTAKLTVKDMLELNLTGYHLASLSACETALTGNQTITTEFVGLVSVFMRAGVSHVLSTLWTVQSDASALVMMQFYRQLNKGKTEAGALAFTIQWLRELTPKKLGRLYQAVLNKVPLEEGTFRPTLEDDLMRLCTIKKDEKLFQHPYHWAAFTISGKFQ